MRFFSSAASSSSSSSGLKLTSKSGIKGIDFNVILVADVSATWDCTRTQACLTCRLDLYLRGIAPVANLYLIYQVLLFI